MRSRELRRGRGTRGSVIVAPWVVAVALLGAAPAPGVEAQDDRRDEEARNLFEAGRAAFADGRFEDALGSFRRSYELSGRTALLFNIGTTLDRLRRDEEALAHFERYLAEEPAAANRSEVEGRLAVLRRTVEERRARTAPSPEPGPEPEATGAGGLSPWPFVAAGASAALGVAAGLLWADANDRYAGLESGCGTTGGCTDAQIDESGAKAAVLWTNVLLVSAVAAGALSIALLAIDLSAGEADTVEVSVRLGPGAIDLRGRF